MPSTSDPSTTCVANSALRSRGLQADRLLSPSLDGRAAVACRRQTSPFGAGLVLLRRADHLLVAGSPALHPRELVTFACRSASAGKREASARHLRNSATASCRPSKSHRGRQDRWVSPDIRTAGQGVEPTDPCPIGGRQARGRRRRAWARSSPRCPRPRAGGARRSAGANSTSSRAESKARRAADRARRTRQCQLRRR